MNTLPQELKGEYPFESHFFKLKNNHKMHYIDEGEGPVLLVVHGNPTWSFYYREVIKEFSKTHRVIAPDHIGCGLSDKPQDYTYQLADHIKNLKELIGHLEVESMSIMVHDWGGAIGLGLAGELTHLIKKTIILNTAAFPDKRIPKRINFCKIPFLGEKIVRHLNGFAWPATFMSVEKPLDKNIIKGYLHPYQNYHDRIATHRFVKDIPMDKGHPSYATLDRVEHNLGSIPGPKLILWGKKDFCFNTHFFERWKKIYPEAKSVLYEKAGHYILEDEKGPVLKEVQAFLK